MTPGNYGSPDPTPSTWPPPPESRPDVWPPAPQTAALTMPFKSVPLRATSKDKVLRKAHHSDFREGSLQVNGAGLLVQGKAVLRAEIRYPIFIVALLIVRLLGIVAYLVMEYAFRTDATHEVTWDAVRLVQFAPAKQQACVIYDAPNFKGVVKTFSLAFTLDPPSYAAFAQQMQQAVPERLADGKLRNFVSMRVWIRLIVLLLVVIGVAISAALNHH